MITGLHYQKKAASYSPTLHCSTIGAGGLNFSVRNGKRWDPAAITTWIASLNWQLTIDNWQLISQPAYKVTIFTSKLLHRCHQHLKIRLSSESIRAISKARLWRHRLYTCLLSTSSSWTTLYGALILRKASHLDAFSAYPYQTRIPGGAPGGTTGIPEVCQPRSSRTSGRSTQNSYAHDR